MIWRPGPGFSKHNSANPGLGLNISLDKPSGWSVGATVRFVGQKVEELVRNHFQCMGDQNSVTVADTFFRHKRTLSVGENAILASVYEGLNVPNRSSPVK